jgi:hypothetical protein
MNEKRMKTSVNTGELSSLLAHEAGWNEKKHAEQGGGSENPNFGFEEWFATPSDGRIIAKTTQKTQFAP